MKEECPLDISKLGGHALVDPKRREKKVRGNFFILSLKITIILF